MGICIKLDEFLEHKTIWEVHLDNGLKIYDDSNRPGESEPSAWLRLKQYVKENKSRIVRFNLRFRDHIESIFEESRGYYCSYGAGKDSADIDTKHFYICGQIGRSDNFKVCWWKIPELIIIDTCDKDAKDPQLQNFILWNYGY